jgi:hypothetical protein
MFFIIRDGFWHTFKSIETLRLSKGEAVGTTVVVVEGVGVHDKAI